MNIDTLAAALEAAKIAENAASAARIDAENALIALCGCKDEGSATHRGGAYKVTITGNVNRRVDPAALDAVRGALSPALFDQAFRYKPEVITAGVRYLQNNEPQAYAIAAQAITATPGKPSVRIEAIEQQAAAP
jgi:hypothetical protein